VELAHPPVTAGPVVRGRTGCAPAVITQLAERAQPGVLVRGDRAPLAGGEDLRGVEGEGAGVGDGAGLAPVQ
jgi:hypothetical protein